jgi:plastocyanin
MKRITLALGVALAALVATASVAAAPTAAQATTVKVTMKEFKFILSKKTVPHGKVTFTVVNKGTIGHDFAIGGKRTKVIGKGKTTKLTVTLSAGLKAYKCTVPGHAAAGMKGKLKVT